MIVPVILVQPLVIREKNFTMEASILKDKYASLFVPGNALRASVNRIYNNSNRKIVDEPRKIFVFEIIKIGSYAYIDIKPAALKLGIPENYYVEMLAMNFVLKGTYDEVLETPIFPNEFFVESYSSGIKEQIESEIETFRKIGESFQVVGLLYQSGFNEIAGDLTEGLTRLEGSDFEGAIKFFRKVVEGFLQYATQNKIDSGDNRSEIITDFLKKSFHMLSNFGEHYGTRGLAAEAFLARDLAVSISKYMVKKAGK